MNGTSNLKSNKGLDIIKNHLMGKPTICIGENKDADQLRGYREAQISFAVTAKLISAFVFATWIVQFLFYLYPKFQASSSFLSLYSLICVGPVRKPHCWFSHEAAHLQPKVLAELAHDLQFEPPRGKTNNVVSEQVRHKLTCTSTEKS